VPDLLHFSMALERSTGTNEQETPMSTMSTYAEETVTISSGSAMRALASLISWIDAFADALADADVARRRFPLMDV
jgi:hypothetical protein